ncbi:MAG: plasmid maintenance system killer protein [Symploca sp. SIO3E6]|nr:plasmid maintenance system killer protein [Caldora sp. SIO3E6]
MITRYPCNFVLYFKNQGTKDIYLGKSSKAARQTCPEELWERAQRQMDMLKNAGSLFDLGNIPSNCGNRQEKLRRDLAGQHSIRINNQYQIYFVWKKQDRTNVEIKDYH